MEENSVSREEMTEALDNLKKEILDQIPSLSTSTEETLSQTLSQNTLIERIEALEESIAGLEQDSGDHHPLGLCFQDSCQPCVGHLSYVVQQARRGLLDELATASKWAGVEQQAGTVVESYQRWEKEGKPQGSPTPDSNDKKDIVTIDLGGGKTIDVSAEERG